MKHLIVVVSAVLLLLSCKKDLEYNAPNNLQSARWLFFETIQNKLKDSLSASDYSKVNFTQLFKSKDAQSGAYFVRIGLLNKSFTTDFILLKTDSIGSIKGGRLIHVDREVFNTPKNKKFNGSFTISSLNREHNNTLEVTNGKWRVIQGAVANEPPVGEDDDSAGEQWLPDVVVTSYRDGGGSMDWYWLEGLYSGGSSGSGNNTYTYGSAKDGGTGGYDVNEDSTIDIELEVNNNSAINVSTYIKCFSTVSDVNATYQITLYADIPVNGDPSVLFNTTSGEVGHSFIELKKSSGGMSLQQNIGFYPVTGWKSLSNFPVNSKIVDNAGHEYNASLTTSLSNIQFQAALNELQAIAGKDYEITSWNCTDFALDVFNAANTGETLTIPKYLVPGTLTYSNTPQGLYVTMKNMQSSGNDSYGIIDIPGVCGYVGASHGSCGD